MKVDKTKFKDGQGRYLSQALFLEPTYNVEYAYYTLDGENKNYKGTVYPSLKKLYLACEDPIEYDFANVYLYDWDHWQKLCNNAIIRHHIDKWRDELELKLASAGVKMLIDQSEANMQAAKWLAERGWSKRGAGRPKKEEIEKDRRIQEQLDSEFSGDIKRLADFR